MIPHCFHRTEVDLKIYTNVHFATNAQKKNYKMVQSFSTHWFQKLEINKQKNTGKMGGNTLIQEKHWSGQISLFPSKTQRNT